MTARTNIDFDAINRAAKAALPVLVRRWLPRGYRYDAEWIAASPRRKHRRRDKIKINLDIGRWTDFATGGQGEDVISLVAYLFGLSLAQAAVCVARMIGLDPESARHD